MVCSVDGEERLLFYPVMPSEERVRDNGWTWGMNCRRYCYFRSTLSNDDYIFEFNYNDR